MQEKCKRNAREMQRKNHVLFKVNRSNRTKAADNDQKWSGGLHVDFEHLWAWRCVDVKRAVRAPRGEHVSAKELEYLLLF